MPKWTQYLDSDYDDTHPSKERFRPQPKGAPVSEDKSGKKEKPHKKEK